MDYLSNNYKKLDEEKGLSKLKKHFPKLLLDDEKIVLSFRSRGGSGRDFLYFTDLRIINIDAQGMTGKKVEYKSISYEMIKSYAFETAGSMDLDVELKIYTGTKACFEFTKSTDIFAIGRLLDNVVLHGRNIGAEVVEGYIPVLDIKPSSGGNMVSGWLTSDNVQLDPKEVEMKFKSEFNILMQDESVEMAFKCGRDSFLMTSKRLLIIDIKGLSGNRIQYHTILWKYVCLLEVETPGSIFDRDADIVIYTSICDVNRINLDLRKGRGDYYALQKYFSDKILGMDTADPSSFAPDTDGLKDKKPGLFGWIDNDMRTIDASMVNEELHSNPSILQNCETVEMAFKGRRDILCLTTKRIFWIDKKGLRGKKIKYVSVPWSSVKAFGVSTKGGGFDNDVEMFVHTNVNDIFYPPRQGDNPPPPPEPRMSYLECSLVAANVDILAIKRYMSERCILAGDDANMLSDTLSSEYILKNSPSTSAGSFLDWIKKDGTAINPEVINQKLHEEHPILLQEEFVIMAFKCGRDMFVLTNKRVIEMDRKGLSGKKTAWISIPYSNIHAYSVESAGNFDRDSELRIFGDFYWYDGRPCRVIKQDMRKGSVDIIAVENLISKVVIGGMKAESVAVESKAGSQSAGGFTSFSAMMKDSSAELDPQVVNEQFHNDPALLQEDEVVEYAFKAVRDMVIYTSKRCLIVDRKGITGKKVEFLSIPLKRCKGFSVQSAGSFLSKGNAAIISNTSGIGKKDFNLNESVDIWNLQEFFAKKLL